MISLSDHLCPLAQGQLKDLQRQLKVSHENQKELKLLLDVFKGSVKESRSKVLN